MRIRKGLLLWIVLFCLLVAGCAVKLVPDYDSGTFEEIIRAEKEVDLFYGNLLETPARERAYSRYAGQYVSIETDLRLLVSRNESRPLNEESASIARTILDFWEKYKARHEQENGYPDGSARLDRSRFTRLFRSALSAEAAKKH